MKKSGFIITIIILLIVILSITQTVLSNNMSTHGVLISKLEKEIHAYRTENIFLSEKLFQESSLLKIASKASELGFVENKPRMVLKSSLPLAIRQ